MSPHNSDDIEDLLRKILHGSPLDREEAARRIVKIFQPKVSAYFIRKGVPSQETEELTQEVFYRVFMSMDTLREESKSGLNAWLFQIAHNLFANYVRSRRTEKRKATVTSIDHGRHGDQDDPLEIPGPEEEPLEVLIGDEQRATVLRELQNLPEKMRECCIQRYIHGLKYKEIADQLGISIETVKAHLFQGRRRLLGSLRGPEGNDGDKP